MVVGRGAHRSALPQPVAEPPVADSRRPHHQEDEEDADEGEEPSCSSGADAPAISKDCLCVRVHVCLSVSVCMSDLQLLCSIGDRSSRGRNLLWTSPD